MLLLNNNDIKKIAEENLLEITDAVEQAVLVAEKEDFLMPERMHVVQGENTHLVMPVYSKECYSTKLVSVFPENADKNIPVISGLMSLNSSETGKPLALLNGASVTGYRTGAVGAVGVRHLASKIISTIGVIGAGVQGYHQIIASLNERDVTTVLIFDTNSDKADSLKKKLQSVLSDCDIIVSNDIDDFTNKCDVIITATTSRKPVLPNNKRLLLGKTIIAIGSFRPNMKELPNVLFESIEKCIVDTKTAIRESGDIIEPIINNLFNIDDIITMGDFIKKKNDIELGNTRLFKSVGMALYDLFVAKKIYEIAVRNGIGTEYEL